MMPTRTHPPITPQNEGLGAIIPNSITPDTILRENPLIWAVATVVAAANAETEVSINFITR